MATSYAYASTSGSGGAGAGGVARSEVGALRKLMNAVAHEHRRASWRRAVQQRTTVIGRAVRGIESALGATLDHRERHGHRWVFFARTPTGPIPIVTLSLPSSRTLIDLKLAPVIDVLAPKLLSARGLERLLQANETAPNHGG